MIQQRTDFYVYELRDISGVTFYVGKGRGKRWKAHRWSAKRGDLKVHRKIRSIWNKGNDYVEVKVIDGIEESVAFDEEIRLIEMYGRKNLCNLTSGGEGVSGIPMSAEKKKYLSDKFKGKVITPEHREKISRAKMGITLPEEVREKIRRKLKGRKLSDEHLKKMQGRKPSAEAVEKRRIANTGKKRTQKLKDGMSEKMKGREIPDEWRKSMSESAKRRAPITEETRNKLRVAAVRVMSDPLRRKVISECHKGRVMSEATKEKLRKAHAGKTLSPEHKKKLSEAKKGKRRPVLVPEEDKRAALPAPGDVMPNLEDEI